MGVCISRRNKILEVTDRRMELDEWISSNYPSINIQSKSAIKLEPNTWKEIRLFISSTFIDTQAERDVLIKRVIPNINRKFASRFIRITPVDLRWGVLAEESKDCESIQKICLNQLDKCREDLNGTPWFLGVRTQRYGWVQDSLMSSKGFEQPELCQWIDHFQECGKHVSITSLECIHACRPPKVKLPAPTVFIYQRNITNTDDIEDDLRWVFDFEYVPENTFLPDAVRYQYNRTDKASQYRLDRERLDNYAKNLNFVNFSTYDCNYKKGDARYTCKNEGKKSFAVGFVSGLDDFEFQVEKDLTEAIEDNFEIPDTSTIPKHIIHNSQHENAVKERASTFVGRSEIFETCFRHCTNENIESNVLIIHGKPGCGKSTVLAAVSHRCVKVLRQNGDFVFVHAVDSCPGSNVLGVMLKRLQENIRHYRRELGESSLSEKCPETVADLKNAHMQFLNESARNHPGKKFIILIDAVNQFHKNLQSWKMWWLPSPNMPFNVRFIISTLNEENGTFENACQVCPTAIKIPVLAMSYADRQEMVTASLKRYNKKLTVTDDKFLGNQMKILLEKSDSALYLIAATEALRKFGIFEKVTEYLKSLPNVISELFNSLLTEWSIEYGERFIRDVTGIICISKDGLLENEINDLLLYKESEEEFSYECSFSRLYDALSSFLAAGGGGYLRFFHDQLKYEVKRKFLTEKVEKELNASLAKFYISSIASQLVESPNEQPPSYYEHCLQQIVYHQSQLPENEVDYEDTLCNIYFIRERITHGQGDSLREEYVNVIGKTNNESKKKALKQWEKFTRIYFDFIEMYPECSYSMACNQPNDSFVAMATKQIPEPRGLGIYPFYWDNVLDDESYLLAKYSSEKCLVSDVGSHNNSLCVVATESKVLLYEIDSSVLSHQLNIKDVMAVHFSRLHNTFWTGNKLGVSVWNVDTGVEEWRVKMECDKGEVIWLHEIGNYMACGTGHLYQEVIGTISILDETERQIVSKWSTKTPCLTYCYHANYNVIISGHVGTVNCWSLDGNLVKTIATCVNKYYEWACCISVSPDPNHDTIATVLREDELLECIVVEIDYTTGDVISTITETGGAVVYDSEGKRLVFPGENKKDIVIYGLDGKAQNVLKAHSGEIVSMVIVPGTNNLLTTANDGSILFDLPSSPDKTLREGETERVPKWCAYVDGGNCYVTLFSGTNKIEKWRTSTDDVVASSNPDLSLRDAVLDPSGKYIIASTQWDLVWIDASTLETVATYQLLSGEKEYVTTYRISCDSTICVVNARGLHILDIRNLHVIKTRGKINDLINTFDIHKDNELLATGYASGLHIYDLNTRQKIKSLRHENTWYVRFLFEPDRIFYLDTNRYAHIMDMNGVNLISFDNTCRVGHGFDFARSFVFLNNSTQLLSAHGEDKTLRLHEMKDGSLLYTFFEHRSTCFVCVAVHPCNQMLIAGNKNGTLYRLKNSRSMK